MARLVMVVDIDLDPTLEDPYVVAEELMTNSDGRPTDAFGVAPEFVSAEWED